MSSDLKHAKRKTTTRLPDGSSHILTESFYEELNTVKEETQQSIKTSADSLAADIINCLEAITYRQTSELSLVITTDKQTGHPNFIVKTWTIRKEHYGAR